MIKRTLYFSQAAYLRLQNQQLKVQIKADESTHSIPTEDVGLVVLDHPQITFTHGLMNKLAEQNVALLWCGQNHLPNALLLPLSGHHLFSQRLRLQLKASVVLKKQLWRQNIQAKILNQAAVLAGLGQNPDPLYRWITKVQPGDTTNIEGRAAAYYWEQYFEHLDVFVQRDRYGGPPNFLLNYAYAILRALVARSLVGSGCFPALGLHHHNQYNAFCLADDLMETYRPFADVLVVKLFLAEDPPPEQMEKAHKTALLKIGVMDVKLNHALAPLMVAVQKTAASLVACLAGEKRKLLLPVLEAEQVEVQMQ